MELVNSAVIGAKWFDIIETNARAIKTMRDALVSKALLSKIYSNCNAVDYLLNSILFLCILHGEYIVVKITI